MLNVIDGLSDLFVLRGVPAHVRPDNVLYSDHWGAARQQISYRKFALAS